MRPASNAFSADTPVADALAWMKKESLDAWPVVNGDGLKGIVRRAELESSAGARYVTDIVPPVQDEFPHLHPDHSLSLALERIGASGLQVIPVVSRANVTELMGVAVLDDILRASCFSSILRWRMWSARRHARTRRGRFTLVSG
jgi:CBS domain-containing protein